MSSTKFALSAIASLASSLLLLASPAAAASSVTPTAPGPGEVFTAGGDCSTTWTPATGSSWKNMTIELMTGSNLAMVSLAKVATGLDGTSSSTTTFTYTCPEVTLYSAVYFYQFTHGNEKDPTWTTRFTIQSASGESVDPPMSEVSDGETVYYGTGALANSATTVASGTAGAAAGTAAGTTTITGTGSGSTATTAADSSSTTDAAAVAANTTTSAASTSTQSGMTSSKTSAANSSTATNSSSNAATTSSSTSGASMGAVVSSLGALFAVSAAFVALISV